MNKLSEPFTICLLKMIDLLEVVEAKEILVRTCVRKHTLEVEAFDDELVLMMTGVQWKKCRQLSVTMTLMDHYRCAVVPEKIYVSN